MGRTHNLVCPSSVVRRRRFLWLTAPPQFVVVVELQQTGSNIELLLSEYQHFPAIRTLIGIDIIIRLVDTTGGIILFHQELLSIAVDNNNSTSSSSPILFNYIVIFQLQLIKLLELLLNYCCQYCAVAFDPLIGP